jgi:pyruvate carboxylase
MFPKVFEEFYHFKKHFGDVEYLPTPAFYYPLKENEEIMVHIESGKNLLIRLRYVSEVNEDGLRDVYFQINGQTRQIQVRDQNVKIEKKQHKKVESNLDIGAPLQGKIVQLNVKEGDEVAKGQALFVIEAMKMESTISSPLSGKIKAVYLQANAMVEQDDCVLTFND